MAEPESKGINGNLTSNIGDLKELLQAAQVQAAQLESTLKKIKEFQVKVEVDSLT